MTRRKRGRPHHWLLGWLHQQDFREHYDVDLQILRIPTNLTAAGNVKAPRQDV